MTFMTTLLQGLVQNVDPSPDPDLVGHLSDIPYSLETGPRERTQGVLTIYMENLEISVGKSNSYAISFGKLQKTWAVI